MGPSLCLSEKYEHKALASPCSVEEKNQRCFGISRAKEASFHLDLCLEGEVACGDSLVSVKG